MVVEHITWVDSAGVDRWITLEDALSLEPCYCHTVGFVLKETDELLHMAHTTAAVNDEYEETVMGVLCIPKVCILNRVVLPQEGG